MTARGVAALALAVACACSGPENWAKRRAADLADAFPVSVASGYGLSAGVRATPLLQFSLGTPGVATRAGYDDRLVHGVWDEYTRAFPFSLWNGATPPRPPGAPTSLFGLQPLPLSYRWQVFRDAASGEGESGPAREPRLDVWGRHPPIGREEGGALLFPPAYRRALNYVDLHRRGLDPDPLQSLGTPVTATLWEVRRNGPPRPRAWDLVEMDVFLVFVGVRLGIRPVEVLDLLAGVLWLDPLGDDSHGLVVADSGGAPAEP